MSKVCRTAISGSSGRTQRGTAGSLASRARTRFALARRSACSAGASQQRLGMGVVDGSRARVDHHPPAEGLRDAEHPVLSTVQSVYPPASRTHAVRMIALPWIG